MDVYWMEQSKANLPELNDWLSTSDLARLSSLRFEKRREDWRLGRWTAKLSIAAYLHLPFNLRALAEIEIRPASSGAPEVFLASKPADVAISLSHRSGTAICAISDSGAALGCDLEIVEARSDAFVLDYFTAEEQGLVAQTHGMERYQLLALLWSGKESALKALGVGLRYDTRCLVVDPMMVPIANEGEGQSRTDPTLEPWRFYGSENWHPFGVRFAAGVFQGWWQRSNEFLRTLVAAPAPSRPIPVALPSEVSGELH